MKRSSILVLVCVTFLTVAVLAPVAAQAAASGHACWGQATSEKNYIAFRSLSHFLYKAQFMEGMCSWQAKRSSCSGLWLKQAHDYIFKTPSVRPRTNHFCMRMKIRITGAIATTCAAASAP
jgi:hypothetical protein